MKKYIEPKLVIVKLRTQRLLQNSIRSVSGLDGVGKGDGDFGGGKSDSRSNSFWDDDEY